MKLLSRVRLFAIPWTVAYQAPPSVEFSRQEYWSGLPFPSLGDLPYPGMEPRSPTLQTDTLPSEPPGKPVLWASAFPSFKQGTRGVGGWGCVQCQLPSPRWFQRFQFPCQRVIHSLASSHKHICKYTKYGLSTLRMGLPT